MEVDIETAKAAGGTVAAAVVGFFGLRRWARMDRADSTISAAYEKIIADMSGRIDALTRELSGVKQEMEHQTEQQRALAQQMLATQEENVRLKIQLEAREAQVERLKKELAAHGLQ